MQLKPISFSNEIHDKSSIGTQHELYLLRKRTMNEHAGYKSMYRNGFMEQCESLEDGWK